MTDNDGQARAQALQDAENRAQELQEKEDRALKYRAAKDALAALGATGVGPKVTNDSVLQELERVKATYVKVLSEARPARSGSEEPSPSIKKSVDLQDVGATRFKKESASRVSPDATKPLSASSFSTDPSPIRTLLDERWGRQRVKRREKVKGFTRAEQFELIRDTLNLTITGLTPRDQEQFREALHKLPEDELWEKLHHAIEKDMVEMQALPKDTLMQPLEQDFGEYIESLRLAKQAQATKEAAQAQHERSAKATEAMQEVIQSANEEKRPVCDTHRPQIGHFQLVSVALLLLMPGYALMKANLHLRSGQKKVLVDLDFPNTVGYLEKVFEFAATVISAYRSTFGTTWDYDI
ncbi:MAG: hypothetical protein Q8O19_01305, partial [Rectinemataceae bacterium]|nr:hypothetical protein [Rectinemataceae bacterium]